MPPSKRDTKLDELLENIEALRSYAFKDAGEKRRAMLLLRAVSDDLQHPYDKILEMWGATSKDAAVKTCLDVDLFNKWHAAGQHPMTAEELASITGVQPALMGALLKHMATWHLIKEDGPDTYSQSEYSLQLRRPEVAACVDLQFDAFFPTFPKLPTYLKATDYVRPTNHKWAPLSYSMNFYGDFFEYMAINTHCGRSLDLTMKGYADYRGSWLDVFPVEQLIEGAQPDQPLVVDVGGGLGHDLEKFLAKHPLDAKDRLILQDQEHVIAKVPDLKGIRTMSHDFLTEQPVRNARAYFLHQILHDWPDDKCRTILDCIKMSMSNDSRILINEMVVSSTGATMNHTSYDMIMLAMSSGRERDEKMWRAFIESADLDIVKIWTSPLAVDAVIECQLK